MVIHAIYPEKDGVVWFGGTQGLVRFDQNVTKNYEHGVNAAIRQVSVADSVVFFGNENSSQNYRLPYENNSMQFGYALPSYEGESVNQFQYFLEGFDKNWSNWTLDTQKDYTNLPEGDYTFKVKARNVYQTLGTEDQFSFSILSPWYRTWWAYITYATLSLGFIQLIIQWRSRQLKLEKLQLEHTVTERTNKIVIKNKQLEEQAVKLKEMDKVKSNFFANISHEFRTPLTLIMGPLQGKSTDEEATIPKKEYNMMRSNADRLLRLINQLLDLSKLETGGLKLQATKRNIVPFVKGLVMSFESLASSEQVALEVIADQQESELYFDDDKLEKILFNLVSNALKFTDKNGRIVVEMRDKHDKVIIEVKDSGIGIVSDQLTHVFDRFYQVDGSQTKLQEGSGIGLALTKELVELHHGTIEVTSKPGEGSQFTVTLLKGTTHFDSGEVVERPPVEKDKMQLNFNSKGKAEPGSDTEEFGIESIDHLLILVVEDNDDVREYIKGHLSPDYAVIEAKNGEEGLTIAREQIPDLVISDVMMPIMDGFELTSKLKTDIKTSHIPVILLTAKAGSEDKIEGLETGADDYLTKPFDGKELIARINNLIKVRQTLWERISKELMMQPASVTVPSMEENFITQVIEEIEEHMSDSELSVEKLSDAMAMSRIHLHRKLKALTDQSASQFIRTIRLKRAKQLLEQKSATVTEIAYEVGFNNISYFAKCFKEQFGVLPSEFEVES